MVPHTVLALLVLLVIGAALQLTMVQAQTETQRKRIRRASSAPAINLLNLVKEEAHAESEPLDRLLQSVGSFTAAPTSTPIVEELQNGVPFSPVAGATGSFKYFVLKAVPAATAVTCYLSGEIPDADLYMRYNARPSRTTFDCSSLSGTSNEQCPATSPPTVVSDLYAGVYGFFAYSEATIRCEYTA